MGGGRRISDHLPRCASSKSPSNDVVRGGEAEESPTSSISSSSYSEGEGDPNRFFYDPLDEEEVARRRRCKTYLDLMQSYDTFGAPTRSLQDAKNAVRSHKPGDWIEEVGGTKAIDYEVPDAITLLLIGPRGSGKSSLVNRITRVFEDDPYSPHRAQVSHNLSSAADGSCFLQEYMIPGNSTSLCVYDTRSLSMIPSDNLNLLKRWMTQGVSHGEMVLRDSDTDATRKRIKAMERQGLFCPCQKRTINFVIFVVDGISVLKSMDDKDTQYLDMVVETFNYPFLWFKDNKPVVVLTHGDELSRIDRARVRNHLGELLGIPPKQQIFDIPDTSDYVTALAIVDMLRYSIKHADRNLPYKQNYLLEGQRFLLRTMDRLQGLDVWVLMLQIFIISLCIMLLLLRGL